MTHRYPEGASGPENAKQTAIRRTWDPDRIVEHLGISKRDVAQRLGIDVANLCRPLSDRQADLYATRLGTHPVAIWGTTWWAPTKDQP